MNIPQKGKAHPTAVLLPNLSVLSERAQMMRLHAGCQIPRNILSPSLTSVHPHSTVHATQQHRGEEVTTADRVPSQGGDSTAVSPEGCLTQPCVSPEGCSTAATLRVVRAELKNGDTSQRQPGGHLNPTETCLERCWQLHLSHQSLALRCSPVRQPLCSGTAFSDTSAAEREG